MTAWEKTKEERMEDFLTLHNGPYVCPDDITLKRYAEKHKLTANEKWQLSYFYSICNSTPSTLILFRDRERIINGPAEYAEENLNSIIFQSDRRWMKFHDSFKKVLTDFSKKRKSATVLKVAYHGNKLLLNEAITEIEKWPQFKRYGAYSLLGVYLTVSGAKFKDLETIDWENSSTIPTGVLHLYGKDREALEYKDGKGIKIPDTVFNSLFRDLKKTVRAAGGNDSTLALSSSLCAFRKLFKESRYKEYYLDMMLEELHEYEDREPEIVAECYQLRSDIFPRESLGEENGWTGVRKQKKKQYLREGTL